MQSANRFVAKNHTLKTLIAAAYNLNPRAISGAPALIDSDRYDILAKTPGEIRPNLEEQMAMLRKLLADRFKLTFHREPKELSIYALTVAKERAPVEGKYCVAGCVARRAAAAHFCRIAATHPAARPQRDDGGAGFGDAAAALDHPVVDRTGLSGRYDFDLEFAPDETQFGGAFGRSTDDPASARPCRGDAAAARPETGSDEGAGRRARGRSRRAAFRELTR